MAITKVAETTFTIASGVTEDKTLPGSPAENDIVIVALANDNNVSGNFVINTASYNSLLAVNDGAPSRHAYWKRMGATPDTVVNITQQATSRTAPGVIQIWRGVDTTTAIDNSVSLAADSGATADPDPPTHETLTDGALRVVLGFLDDDDAASGATAPSGYGDLVAADTGAGSTSVGTTVLIASKTAVSAGSEDPDAFGTPGADAWGAAHFALRPAAGGATIPAPVSIYNQRYMRLAA